MLYFTTTLPRFRGNAASLAALGAALWSLGGLAPEALADTGAAAASSTADAQPGSGSAATGTAGNIGDIVVTATRRESRLQQTPVAVSVFGSGQIGLQHLTTTRDLAGQTPGVTIMQSGITPTTQVFFIRGMGNSDPIFDPPVAVYIDDVYLPRTINGQTDLTDIERIEVLRGPQGTLFGENAGAGAVRYVTRTPTDKTELKVDIGYGNYNTVQAHGYLAGALIPGLLDASIAVARDQHDGYTWDPVIARHVNDQDLTSGRAKLLFTPSPDLKVLLSLDGSIDHSTTAYYVPVSPIIGGTLANPVYGPYRPNTSYVGWEPVNNSHNGGGSVKASYILNPHLTVHSITALRAFSQNPINYDNSGQPFVPFTAANPVPVPISDNYIIYKEHEFTQELQLQGQFNRLNFTGGLYYLFENFSSNRMNYSVSPVVKTASPAYLLDQIGKMLTRNYAAYLQGDYKITDRLTLTLGGRYTSEWRHFDFNGVYTYLDGTLITPVPGADPSTAGGWAAAQNFIYSGQKSWHSFTPKAGISEQLTRDLFLYASFTKGFDAGGFNNRATSLASVLPYNQEDVTAYEAGIKSDWLNHRLRINLTGFYNKYNGLQETAAVTSPITGILVSARANAGRAHTTGFELETTARPANGLTLGFNASYLSTRFDSFPNASSTAAGALISATGNQLPISPHWQLYGSINYNTALGGVGTLTLGANITHETSYFSDVYNYVQGIIHPQTFVNGYVAFQPLNSHWNFTLSGHNLANRFAYQSLTWGGTPSLYQGPQNPPRTIFFKVSYIY